MSNWRATDIRFRDAFVAGRHLIKIYTFNSGGRTRACVIDYLDLRDTPFDDLYLNDAGHLDAHTKACINLCGRDALDKGGLDYLASFSQKAAKRYAALCAQYGVSLQ